MARWQRTDFFSGWWFIRSAKQAKSVSKTHRRHNLLMGVHSLGMLLSLRNRRTHMGPGWLRDRCGISFSGIPVFWTQPIFLGMDCQFSSDCVLLGSVVIFTNQRHTQQQQSEPTTGSEDGIHQSRQSPRRKNPSITAIEPT